RAPAFPFGFGLSYTTFALGPVDITVDADGVRIRGTVRNTGDRDGADVVQVYAELPDPDAPARLVAFSSVVVGAGEEEAYECDVPRARLATRHPSARAWRPGTGRHRFVVARYAGDPDAQMRDLEL